MDDDLPHQSELGNDSEDLEPGFANSGQKFWIDGVHLSPFACPACLRHDEFDCEVCEFFVPDSCHLLADLDLREDLRTLFELYREQHAAPIRRRRELIHVLRVELQAHGRPLHYTVLARMVADRHPELRVSEAGILRLMTLHADEFECVGPGVYWCRKGNKAQL